MSDIYVLKEYYTQYLKKIRSNSTSTVIHYLSALEVISTYLAKKKIKKTIYEITDLNNLQLIKEDLYQNPVFVDKDERGHRMYSAGLNNYYRFACGESCLLYYMAKGSPLYFFTDYLVSIFYPFW